MEDGLPATRIIPAHTVKRLAVAIGLLLVLCTLPAAPARAAESPVRQAAQSAQAWLSAQQAENGSFGQTPWRDSDLAVEALGQLDPLAQERLASWIATSPPNVDYLARRIAMSTRIGSQTETDTATLLGFQQADGGFPLSSSYPSDVFDTLLALRSLSLAATATVQQQRAVDYLLAARRADGGWSYTADGPLSAGLTAEVITELDRYQRTGPAVTGLPECIQQARTLLLSERASDGSWGSLAHTALAHVALAGTQPSYDESGTVDWILANQRDDGSFGSGDIRDTALAVQALRQADRNVSVVGVTCSDSAPRQGGIVRVTAVVSNDGLVNIGGLGVRLSASSGGIDETLATLTIPSLSANTTASVSFNYDTQDASGTVEFTAIADPGGAVFETNEADNTGSSTILVRTALLAPTPVLPSENALIGSAAPTFVWSPPPGVDSSALTYVLQLDRSSAFDSSFEQTFTVPTSFGAIVSYQLPAGVTLSDGVWFWRVRAVEGDVNSPACTARQLTVDKTAPIISGLSGSPTPFSPNGDGIRETYRATLQLSEECSASVQVVAASGTVLGLARGGLTFDSGHVVFEWDGKLEGSASLADGSYRLRIDAVDRAGNATSATTAPITIDTTPPAFSAFSSTATSISPNADGLYDRVSFNWSMSADAVMTVRVSDSSGKLLRVDQGKVQTYAWEGKNAQNIVVPSGDYSLSFTCQDEAGNAAEQVVRPIKVKTACAVGGPRLSPAVARPGAPVELTIPVQDESSVVATVSGSPIELTRSADGEAYVAQLDAPSTPGNYPVQVEARDSLGNVTRPVGTALVVRSVEVTGSLWVQDTHDDFRGGWWTNKSVMDSMTIEARSGSMELSTLGWERLADMPVPRYGAQTCLGPDGLIYVIGGTYEITTNSWPTARPVRNTSVFDPETGVWSERAPIPTAREGGSAVFAPNGKIYVIGGNWVDSAGSVLESTATVECYDPATDTWERDTDHGGTLAPMPTARSYLGAAVGADGRIYCVGGLERYFGWNRSTDAVEVYDPLTNSWETKASMPQRQCCFATGGVDGKIYVLEGEYREFNQPSGRYISQASVFAYDPMLDVWTSGASSSVARTDALSSVGRDGRVYVYGGVEQSSVNAVPYAFGYSPSEDSWVRADDMPIAVEHTQGVSDALGRPYAIGGARAGGGITTVEYVQRYDPYYRPDGTFISSVKDTLCRSTFGAISWEGSVPPGTELTVATRTSLDGVAWSQWSEEYLVSGSSVTSPVGQFIQYRVTMHSTDPLKSPRVDRVTIAYSGSPSAPTIAAQSFRTPTPSVAWSPATDPENDPVTYDLQVDTVASFDSQDLHDFREIDPQISIAPGFQLPSDASLTDGEYWARVRASDGRNQSAWSQTQTLRIDATPPSIRIDSVDPSVVSVKERGAIHSQVRYTLDETCTVRLNVLQLKGTTYSGARQYNVSNVAAGAQVLDLDGLTDSGQPLQSGAYKLEISATDSLQNQSVIDAASLTVRRAPDFSMLTPSVDSRDPQASCEAVITAVGEATDARMLVGSAGKTLVDSDANGTFTGRLVDAPLAGVHAVDGLALEDGLSGYGTPPVSGRLTVPGYVPGVAWRESSQADLADGIATGVKADSGALSLDAMKWRTLGYQLATPRYDAASARIGSKVYIVGGASSETYQSAVALDLETGQQSVLAPAKSRRRGAAAVAGPDGRFWVFGGVLSAGNGESYDPVTNTWQQFTLPSVHPGSSAFVGPDGRIYLVGGGSARKTVEALNTSTMTWSTRSPLITGVDNAGACLIGDKYYVFGGFTGWGTIAQLQVYDVATDTWSIGPSLPAPWSGRQVQKTTDGLAYIIGDDADRQGWTFNPATGSYTPFGQIARRVAAATSASYNGTIYSIGGLIIGSPNVPTGLIEAYDTVWRGSYVSSAYDAGRIVDWGTLGWTSFEPSGTTAAVQTRSSVDGTGWSDWTGDSHTGDQISSPSGRFIQYRVDLASVAAPWTPALGDVTIGIDDPQPAGLTPPMPERPAGAVFDGTPEIGWTNSAGGISRTYEVQVDSSPSFDGPGLRTFASIPELMGSSLLYLPSSSPLAEGRWYWRVRASDGLQESAWSPVTAFDVLIHPALAVDSLQVPNSAEEGDIVALSAVVANHGAPATGCAVRFEDATSGELIGSVDGIQLGHEETAAVSVQYPTEDKSGARTLSARIVSPTDGDPTDDSATAVLNVSAHGFSASVAPDRMAYSAEETVSLTVTSINGGTLARDVQVSLRVLDAEGVLVEDIGGPIALQLTAGQSATSTADWNTGAIYPGDYFAQVVLTRDGRTCFTSQAPFTIAENVSLSGRVSVDRIAYGAHDRVQVSSRVSNASSNAASTDLRVMTTVLDSAGEVLASSETTIAQLQRGESKLFGLEWNVEDADPGSYSATEEVTRADGSIVVTGTVGFDVRPSSQTGAGLSAALDAAPTIVHQSESCAFTYQLINDGNSDMDIPLTLSVVDPETSGTVLAVLSGSATVAEDGSAQGEFVIDTKDLPRVTASAGKHLLAVLQGDIGGTRFTLDSATVQVLPVVATAAVITDASEYDVRSSVNLATTVSNETTGYALDGVEVELRITNPDGLIVHDEARTLPPIHQGEPNTLGHAWATGLAEPGTYEASVSVTYDGMLMSAASTQFVVLSTAQTGTGLNGQVTIEKRDLFPGDDLTAEYVIANDGNSAVSPLAALLSLEDATTGEVLAQQPCPHDLPRGAIETGTATFMTDDLLPAGTDSRQLIVRLRATVERGIMQLGSADAVVQQGVRLNVTKRLGSMPRVLVWCESASNRLTAENALVGMGAFYAIVDNPDDFIAEMRSGVYDTLVILDTKKPLPAHFDQEVAERVNSGATLIGTRWANMDNFKGQGIFGVSFKGFLPDAAREIPVPESSCTVQRQVDVTGKVQSLQAAGAQVVASWQGYPMIALNDCGRGTAVLFAFDFAGTDADTGAGLLRDAIEGCPPDEGAPDADDVAVVEVTVENQGVPSTVQIDETVENATIVRAIGTAAYDAHTIRWVRTIGQGETATVRYLARLDGGGATALLTSDTSVERNGAWTPVMSAQLSAEPGSTDAELLADAITKLSSVTTTSKSDSQIKERALRTVRAFQASPPDTWGEHGRAIWDLVGVCEDLERMSVDTATARLAVDELMRLYEARWLQ